MKENKFRCHFSIVIEEVFSAIWLIVLITLGKLIDDLQNIAKGYFLGGSVIILYVLLGIIFITSIVYIIMWRKTYIYLDRDALVIERNTIFSKKNNTIALNNISNVNLEQNIFERLIGTYKIKLDTNSSSTANETDIKIILKKDKAEIFKKRILSNLKSNVDNTINEEEKEEIYTIKYSLKEVVLHSIYSMPIYMSICAGAVLFSLIGQLYFDNNNKMGQGIINILLGIIVIVIAVIYSLCKNLFKFYDFKVGRKGDNIYINYGLITKREYTIPVDKINGIIVVEPTISRIFKKKSVEIVNIGMGDDDNESSQVLLSEDCNKYKEKLKSILPEIEINEKLERQPKEVFYSNAVYVILNLILIVVFSAFTTMWFMLYMIIPIVYYVFKYITNGIRIDEKYLAIATGFFQKKTKYITYNKIQNISIKQGPIARKYKIAKCNIYILSSLINNVSCTGHYNIEELEKINDNI